MLHSPSLNRKNSFQESVGRPHRVNAFTTSKKNDMIYNESGIKHASTISLVQ